jgi:hypothetical protein
MEVDLKVINSTLNSRLKNLHSFKQSHILDIWQLKAALRCVQAWQMPLLNKY